MVGAGVHWGPACGGARRVMGAARGIPGLLAAAINTTPLNAPRVLKAGWRISVLPGGVTGVLKEWQKCHHDSKALVCQKVRVSRVRGTWGVTVP